MSGGPRSGAACCASDRRRGTLRRSLILAALLASTASAQETARQSGDALREALRAAGPRQDLVGRLRLPLYVGGARAGAINLRTDVVERDGVQVYRVHDRLDLDLPGLGAVRMLVQADLRADLSAVEVVLETEEPRGVGAVSRHRITLRRERGDDGAERWVRQVVRGEAAPVVAEVDALGPDVLVLTPPLGAGERLTRLAPARLGARLSVAGLDLETGKGATYRLSLDEERPVRLAEGREVPGLVASRSEGAAQLEVLRDPSSGAPWRLVSTGGARPARLVALDPAVAWDEPEAPAPARCVLALLRAACSGDRVAARAALDVDALHADAGEGAGSRETFESVLLERLTDAGWLRDRGLLVAALAAGPADLVVVEDGPDRARVRPTGREGEDVTFAVERRDGAWRVVRLPR